MSTIPRHRGNQRNQGIQGNQGGTSSRYCPQFSGLLALLVSIPLPALAGGAQPLFLLEPIGGLFAIPATADATFIINAYLSAFLPWLMGFCAVFTVLMVVVGGTQVMISGVNEEQKAEGKARITSAIIGFLLLIFAATVLNFLNSSFFV